MVVLGQHSFSFGRDHERTAYVQVDGQALSNELASVDVSRAASIVAKNPSLRASLLAIQREAFPGEGMVAEGRDTGTVVFPAAQVKFFVTARLDVRSRRRFDQLAAKGQPAALEEISRELAERDKRDAERETAPMKAASDAVTIDNSDNPLDEIAQRMASHVRERVGKAA
jgi:cytidylate kinase